MFAGSIGWRDLNWYMVHLAIIALFAFLAISDIGIELWRRAILFAILVAITYVPGRWNAGAEERISGEKDYGD